MKRKIIEIDENKCNGCGLCANSCAEGALAIIGGKAKLVSDSFCDGLGACLADCPQDALKLIEREAAEFSLPPGHPTNHTCPGSALRSFNKPAQPKSAAPAQAGANPEAESALTHWPVQLKLVPAHAPFLKGAEIVICADCVPFALPDFHSRYLQGRAVLVGCPKLDDIEFYREKLRDVVAQAQPSRIIILRMEVPCCSGIARAATDAVLEVSPETPFEVHTIGVRGEIVSVQNYL